ncbi:MAG: 4-hydroxybenzoate octaprenyltransferase [Proteobacteria bacterium]|nr:4-hydroxybenzoate octaprenyltransferase [Pseudomonadota bacterium]
MDKQTTLISKAQPFFMLMRIDRPIGTLLLLWPTYWALWSAAGGLPDFKILLIFTLGVFLMRSAGCVINDISDRKYDRQVKRTMQRPLAQNLISITHAWLLFVVLMLLAVLLLLFLKPLTIKLALVSVFFAVTYPFMKRLTYLPQVYLGIAFAWSIPMAFAEITGEIPKIAWLLFVINILWTTAYDTIYAMIDRKDDIKIGIKSTAILFGDLDKGIVAVIQVLFLMGLLFFGKQSEFGLPFYLAIVVTLSLIAYQQWLIKDRKEDQCFKAFLNNNWVGFVVFAGIFVDFLLKTWQ